VRIPLVFLFLAGCASTPPEIMVVGEPIRTPTYVTHPAPPKPLDLKPVNSIVITREIAEYVYYNTPEATFIAMPPADYETLLLNMLSVENYILQLQLMIRTYKKSLEDLESTFNR